MNVVHPVVAAATAIDGALKDVADVDPVFMDVADQRTVLLELCRLETRLAELRLRVMAASGQVAADEGARDVAAWLAHRARLDRGECRRDLGLATRLERDRPVLAEAVRAGEVNRTQAEVVVRALDDLPAHVGADIERLAEERLAARHTWLTTRRRGDGTTIPAAWCEAHHAAAAWTDGGTTDLADGLLLCSHHHHRAHDRRYDLRRLANGDVRFRRRT